MKALKQWWLEGLATPDKARTRLSNIAMGMGAVGFALVVLAVVITRF